MFQTNPQVGNEACLGKLRKGRSLGRPFLNLPQKSPRNHRQLRQPTIDLISKIIYNVGRQTHIEEGQRT